MAHDQGVKTSVTIPPRDGMASLDFLVNSPHDPSRRYCLQPHLVEAEMIPDEVSKQQ